jgi:hypothetical protein
MASFEGIDFEKRISYTWGVNVASKRKQSARRNPQVKVTVTLEMRKRAEKISRATGLPVAHLQTVAMAFGFRFLEDALIGQIPVKAGEVAQGLVFQREAMIELGHALLAMAGLPPSPNN